MVSFNVYRATSSGAYIEGVCLASDEKPIVGISNGSILYAVDASDGTTTRYMFDQSTASWIEAECPCSGGGSGGGGSSGGGTVKVELTEEGINKSYADLVNIFNGGSIPFMVVDEGENKTPLLCSQLRTDGVYHASFNALGGGGAMTFAAENESIAMAYSDEPS